MDPCSSTKCSTDMMMLHNVLFCIEWHTYISILFKCTKMSKFDFTNVPNWTTYRCFYIIQWHINVENWIKEHINDLYYISRLSGVFSIAYTHNSQCLPSQKTTHLMFFRDSHKGWGLSIANWCRIGPTHDSSEGVRVSDDIWWHVYVFILLKNICMLQRVLNNIYMRLYS